MVSKRARSCSSLQVAGMQERVQLEERMRQVPASCEEEGRSERGAHHSPQLVQLLVQHVFYLPVGLDLRDGKQEAPEDLVAPQGVPHLRVVLQRVYPLLPVLDGHPHSLPMHIMPCSALLVDMHFCALLATLHDT